MADLYAKPYEVVETGYNPQQSQQNSQQSEMEAYLSSLPPQERQAAIERINAPLSGEELAMMANNDRSFTPTLEQFAEIEKFHKNHEISFLDGIGKIAEGGEQVMADLSNAVGSFIDSPLDSTKKMPATAVEAFAQGTRNFYGMLAQSQNPDSILFGVKDFLNGTGTIEDRYNQYIRALNFNRDSADIASGKTTLVMDKDMINPEITQAMSYIADPTLFIPFGKIASTGLRAVGLGEKLMLAGAKATAIKNGVIGGAIKWGAGQPLEFLGGAVRNTIDYGLEKGGQAFEATTGISGKEFAQTARMSGVGFSVSGIAGYAVPYASTISDAYIAGSSARGFGEALTLLGDTMKRSPFGRGINSWAAESLAQAEKNGVKLSPHAKGLLNVLNAVDPLFGYAGAVIEGSSHGIMIGGALGYASGGEEGMYHGMGAGMALGGVGGLAGKTVADVTGGTAVARRAVQAKMVIEGLKETNKEKAMFFQAMQKATEARGQDVDLVNGIIAGIDKVAPNFEFHAMTPEQFAIEGIRKGYDPSTGKFMEMSAIDHEFGGDRLSKSKAMYILRSVGGDFVGDSKSFLDALKRASARDSANPNKPASNIPSNLRKYIDVAKTFEKLSKTQQDAILKEIDGQKAFADSIGGKTKLREHYDALSWSEAWTDSLVKKFETDREGARKDIVDMLAQETKKNGELTKKGRALTDKLRAEGFLDREGKLLRERNLLQADMKLGEFAMSKGAVIARESDGKTHMYINLNRMGDETFPHELYHTIMRESPMKKHFTDSVVQKLLGVFDADGNLVREGEVNLDQTRKFIQKYIDLTSRNDDGTLNVKKADETMKLVNEAIEEYRSTGKNKKISDKARGLLEHYTEEFGAYYFSHWLMGRNRNTLFFGGELKGIEGVVERTKDAFLDFWQSKVSKANPTFDFAKGLNASFDRSEGLGRISSMDYFMRDMVRAASNANREFFRPDSMSIENLRDFERSNGIRNLTGVDNNRRLNPREQVTQNIRLGKEAYKILTGLDKNLRTSKDVIDENGKKVITGRFSEAELDALVKGGIVPRAWADKVNQGYAMLDGTVSNIFSAGYLGKTEQTTDASYPRLTGKDVSFKNRKAVLFGIDTKVNADGTFYTLFHTLDLAVIEQRGNHLWQNTDYKNLWNGDRSSMEADFFRYISNASKASTDPKKLDSAALLEKGDGLGAKRRDVLQQMAGMALQTGDAYKHQPIAVIPEGIRHSVTTFNVDGLTMPKVESGSRYDIDMGNAHKFIRENWQPDDMVQEKTNNGVIMTHESGFKFAINADGKASAYANDGSKIGTFGSIKEATTASKNLYNKAQDNITKIANDFKQKEIQNRKNLQPLDDATYEEAFRIGDIFKTKRMQEIVGNSKLVRQTFDEFLSQRVEEINSGKSEQEKGAILAQLFNSEFKELIDLEAELRKTYDEFNLQRDNLDKQEKELTDKIVELSQEKKRLQQFSDRDTRVDVGILEMYENMYKRKQEVNKRMSEIANKMHNEGISDLNSHYYITKRLLEKFNETGKLSEEAIKFAITPKLIKDYEANFETGKAITFLANHGTPNHELMVSKTFNTAFLGRNTGSMSAFNATFFAGSKDTSIQYVGTPIPKTWVRDFIQARKYYVDNFTPEFRAKLESMLSSDTSKGVVQKVKYLMDNAHIEFPDDFKLKDTGRKTKEGEPIIRPSPESHHGYDIDGFLNRILGSANDEGAVFGGVQTYWDEAGRTPYLLRNIVKMDNPYVHEYAKADFRDETFASVINRAKAAGHDGVIFKNTRDGGGLDTIFASFAKNEDNKIFTLETSEDTRFVPRGTDEAGNKVKGGSEIEGRKYQPTEEDAYQGGRTYNQNGKKWKSGFIGLWAEQNPDRLKGYNIEFFQKEAGAYRIRLQDNSVNGRTVDVGHITAVVSGDTATISSKIANEYQGNKLSYALYSEMAERLRAMGIRRVDGQIVNKDGVPIRVRERIIGDTRDYFSGKPIDQAEGARRIREKQEMVGDMGGVDVYNELYQNARYQPAEGRIESIHEDNINIDSSIAETQALKIAQDSGINILRGKTLSQVFVDKKNKVKGGLWTEINGNEFSFDIAVDKDSRKKGIGSALIKSAIQEFDSLNENGDLTFKLDVTSNEMKRLLEKNGFKVTGKEQGHTFMTRYQPAEGTDWTNRIARTQRGDAEDAMLRVQKVVGGGAINYSVEHSGDILHRTYEDIAVNYHKDFGYNNVKHKVTSVADAISEIKRRGFWKIEEENYPSATGAKDKTFEEHKKQITKALKEFADEHDKLPAENDLQRTVKTINKAIGNQNFDLAQAGLQKLLGKLKSEKSWIEYASEGMKDWNPDGESSIKQQPAEGGRTYTDEQMSSKFIGRYAEENPNIKKGKKIFFSKDIEKGLNGGETYRIRIESNGETSGYINVEKHGTEAHVEYVKVDILKSGRGYGNLLYSEMTERLRSLGVKEFSGWVTDPDGRPIKIRRRIIDKENARVGGERTKVFAERAGGRDTISQLHPDAHYQPSEGGRTYTAKQMDNEFIGRIAEENPELTKGLKLYYGKVPQGMGAVGVTLRNKKGDVVANIKAMINRDAPNYANIEYSEVTEKQQGKGFGKLVYSELIERLRSLGVEEVSGTVIDNQGRPQAIRRTVIDDVNKGLYKEFSKEGRSWKTREEESTDLSEGMDVTSYLHPKAHYMMAEERVVNYSSNDERVNYLMSVIDSVPHYKKAFDSGQLSIDAYNPEAFKDYEILSHAPDTASTVEQKNFTAQGGVGYPLLFPEEGWAAVSRGLEKRLNAIGEANFKKHGKWIAPMALVLSHAEKMKGARNGTSGFMAIIKQLEGKKVIDNETLRTSLIHGLKSIGTEISDDAMLSNAMFKTYKMLENSTSSGFKQRAKFVSNVAGSIARNTGNLTGKQIKALKEIIPTYKGEKTITKKDLIPAIFQMFEDPLVKGLEAPDKKTGGNVYAFVLFDKPLVESESSPHASYKYSVRQEDNAPVRVDLLSRPMKTLEMFKQKVTSKGVSELKAKTIVNDTGQRNFPYGRVIHAEPAEGWRDWQSERTSVGSVIKNTAGYVIMVQKGKFKVYNPYKSMVGIYDSEEQAKRRVQKDEPRR